MTTSTPFPAATIAPPAPPLVAPPGLKGLVVADTALGDVRGAEGFFHYRRYDATELARHHDVEDVWHLLVEGELPTPTQRRAFTDEVTALRAADPRVLDVLPVVVAASDNPVAALRTVLSLEAAARGLQPLVDLDAPARRGDALALGAVVPTLVAALHRTRLGRAPVEPRPDLTHAANLLWMLRGAEAEPAQVRALQRYLVATMDHGFNASTFTARVIASTGADMGACVVGALGALSGPRRGGAPSRVLDLLDDIAEPARAAEVVGARLRAGERIPGFGHAVYRGADPRSDLLRHTAQQLGGPRVALADAAEHAVQAVLVAQRPGHDLQTNVEWWGGVVMEACGIPRDLCTATFAVSRTLGWGAHILEQCQSSAIIRPSGRYVGPPPGALGPSHAAELPHT